MNEELSTPLAVVKELREIATVTGKDTQAAIDAVLNHPSDYGVRRGMTVSEAASLAMNPEKISAEHHRALEELAENPVFCAEFEASSTVARRLQALSSAELIDNAFRVFRHMSDAQSLVLAEMCRRIDPDWHR